MNDKELQRLLPDFLSGRLDEATWLEINRRLEISAELRTALEAAKLYTDAVGAIEPPRAPDDFLDKVHRRIEVRNGLLDRLFRPLHIKLPIELAGVAVTVMLVVLLYNPFSGKLPQQAVEMPRDMQQFTEPKESAAAIDKVPANEPRPMPPMAMERPASGVADKKSLRRSGAESVTAGNSTGDLRKESALSYKSSAAVPAVVSAPGITASTPVVSSKPPASIVSASRPDDEYAGRITGTTVPSASPALPARAGLASSAAKKSPEAVITNAAEPEYESSAADAAPQQEELRYSSRSRADAGAATAGQAARSELKLQDASAEVSFEKKSHRSPHAAALGRITGIVNRFQGTIDTVYSERNDPIRLKLSVPAEKFGAFKTTLAATIKGVAIINTSAASDSVYLTIIIEVHP